MTNILINTDEGTEKVADRPVFPNDSELVALAKSCPEAFGELYDIHYGRILNYLYRHTLDVHVAEELTSNTFFKALRGLGAYRDEGNFRAWLYRIATNELRMFWRSAKKQQVLGSRVNLECVCTVQADKPRFDDVEEALASYSQLNRAMDGLPERYRTAIALRYFEKLPYSEVAEVLGKRIGTVKSLVHRGLRRLQRLMQENHTTLSRDQHLRSQETNDETN